MLRVVSKSSAAAALAVAVPVYSQVGLEGGGSPQSSPNQPPEDAGR